MVVVSKVVVVVVRSVVVVALAVVSVPLETVPVTNVDNSVLFSVVSLKRSAGPVELLEHSVTSYSTIGICDVRSLYRRTSSS